jgi:hypothetical protein
MKDYVSTCMSAGIAYVLSNYYYESEEPAEERVNSACAEVEYFIETISDFMPMDEYSVDSSYGGRGPFTVVVKFRLFGEEEERRLNFTVTVTGTRASVVSL